MEGILDVLSGAASVASGGIFGLLGAVVGQVSRYFQTKAEREFKKLEWEQENKLLELQMQAKQLETEQELAIVSQTGAWDGLEAAVRADARVTPVSNWAVNAKALFRPFLTISLWLIAGFVFYAIITGELHKWMTGHEVKDLIQYMVYTVFFSASTATVFWFGDRALTPPNMKNR